MNLRTLCSLSVAALLLIGTTSCTAYRATTTTRTGIEQALMSQSAKESLSSFSVTDLAGKTFKIDDSALVSSDKDVIKALLEQRLLADGMNKGGDDAEVTIRPIAEVSAVDDSELLFGIPAIGVPTPGGIVGLPELAFFKRDPQRGRNKITILGTDTTTGEELKNHEGAFASRYFVRHKILLFFAYNNSNLGKPY
ncbi:MAG: hypothetical protein ACFCU1_11495 [Sumerlaeia bacterium]